MPPCEEPALPVAVPVLPDLDPAVPAAVPGLPNAEPALPVAATVLPANEPAPTLPMPPTAAMAPVLPLPATRASFLTEQPATLPPTSGAAQPVVTMPAGQCCNRDTCGPKQCAAIFTPFMLGDFSGPLANLFSDVKIAEGESPRPVDRVFYQYNYYNNLNKARWTSPTEPIHNVELGRHTFGFEKTFLNQSVSLGLRVPFNSISADGKPFHLVPDPTTGTLVTSTADEGFDTMLLGNVSAIVKAVLCENRQTGSLISGGATISVPTASNVKIDPGMSVIAYMQPFVGYILNRDEWFVQGFSSLTVPLVSAQSIVMFNDIGVGYWLMRNRSGMITGVAPTMEMHVATPLRQSDPNSAEFGDGLRVFDVFDMTIGATILFGNSATLGLGMVVPLTGPKPFDVEVLAQLNYRF
jgi:hypothetical protein